MKIKKQIVNIWCVLLCIYLPGYNKIMDFFVNPSIVALFLYVSMLFMFVFLLLWNKRHISKKVCVFYIIYILCIFINAFCVSYKFFVFTEGITSILLSINIIYVISLTDFNIHLFLYKWRNAAVIATFSLFLLIILFKLKIVSYGIFAWITMPNVIILSWEYINRRSNLNSSLLLVSINVVITLFFGGRMAALVGLLTIFSALVFYKRHTAKEMFLLIFVLSTSIIIVLNIKWVILILTNIFSKYGYHSRTLDLIAQNIAAGGFLENIYMSGREEIYAIVFEWIKERGIYPSGLAVVRYLTEGEYYIAHNLLLELIVTFGILGTVFIFIFLLYRLRVLRQYKDKTVIKFAIFLLSFYFIYSLTVQSIFSSPLAFLLIAVIFFYKPHESSIRGKLFYNSFSEKNFKCEK